MLHVHDNWHGVDIPDQVHLAICPCDAVMQRVRHTETVLIVEDVRGIVKSSSSCVLIPGV